MSEEARELAWQAYRKEWENVGVRHATKGEAVRDAKTPREADMLGANSDGQISVLERLLSDLKAGLWRKGK